VPKSRGGSDTPDNHVIACFDCNNLKGDRSVEEFRVFLQERFLQYASYAGSFGIRFKGGKVTFYGDRIRISYHDGMLSRFKKAAQILIHGKVA